MTRFILTNKDARRTLLHLQGLSHKRRSKLTDAELASRIHDLGYVQLDTINTVERAHHQILFSRNETYKHDQLKRLHESDQALFEGFTHDACVIPMEFYPYWRTRFRKAQEMLLNRPGWSRRLGDDPKATIRQVMKRIEREGPTMSRDFEKPTKGNQSWWGWSPTKTALEYQWYSGKIAVVRREGFQKVYDLTERVIPETVRTEKPSKNQIIDWKCRNALMRLGFGTCGEIARFWEMLPPAAVKAWADPLIGKDLVEIDVEGADGSLKAAIAFNNIEDVVQKADDTPTSLRFLSPFDPAIRDRKRTERLFDLDYRIEIFVPEKKRQFGYYVLPILEGERFTGRADLKVHRKEGKLEMKGLWLEPGVKFSKGRQEGLRRELSRLAKFTGASEIEADQAIDDVQWTT